ncbi:uncharacterized protein [Euwallacea fornicatus]|uniref:uncharacterized protein isoform X2 n=1 Tax=Euwallacea fornicatus TaxID=995702 RepID=UPI00338F7AA7
MVLFLIYRVTCVKMEIFIAFLVVLGPIVPFSEGVDTCFVDTPKAFYIKDIFYGDIFKATVLDKTELKGFNITKNTAGLNDKDLLSYFNLNMKDNVLIMSTADPYKNFAKLAYSDSDVAIISTTIFLTCSGESNDEFMSIIIADSFSHLPVFDQNSYEYGVAMPIMPTLDITYYGTKIQVSEDNFSNKDITFSIDPDDFTIDSVKISDKIFNASFSANKVLQFSENQTYILTATNSIGNSSSVPLIIYADEDSGLDSPLFQKAHYSFEYSDGDLKPKDGVIKVNSIKLNESNYNIEGDNKENFKLTFNNNTGEFPLELMDSFPSTLKGRMVLDLKFTTDATTSTVLLINIAEVVPTFSNGYYDGIYNPDSNAIEWDVIPNVSKAVSLTVDENVKTLFTVNQTDYTITPTSKLTAENFDGNGNIIFTLKAHSSTANEAEAVVVVSLQSDAETELQFADPYYEGSYGTNSKVTLNSQFTFKDLTDLTGIEISVDAPYNDNFDIELKDDKWTVKVIKKLSKDVLNDNTHLLVPITGTKSGLDGSAKAVLMLDLPEKVVIQFSELYYTGTYLQDDEKDSVHLDKAIKITGIDGEDAVFAVEGYENYLNLSCSSDTCKIDVIQKFDDSILTNANYLTMTIKATYEDLTNQAVLVLDLPVTNKSDAQIEFKNIHYSAQYNIDSKTGKGSVDLNDGPIEFENSDNLSVDFQFEADYKNNFDLTCTVETSTCEISVKKELENSTLAKSGPLIITITATASQEKLTSQTVLVLDLPSNEDTDAQIEFKNIHYSAQYNIDSKTGKGSVDLNDGPIEFENSDNLSVDFQFEADYKNNFDLTCTVETSTCEISVKKELENSTLAKSGPLIITITATASQEKLTSQTVLVLDLPSNEDTDAQIEFKNIHYSAQYNIDSKTGKGSVDLNDGPIEFENSDNLSVDFQFEADYKNNFDLTCTVETSTCEISVKKELENSTLAKSGPLIITITATASQEKLTSQTVLVLDLPSNEDTDAQIEFKNIHYSAQYNIDSKTGKGSVDLNDGPIEFENSDNLSVDFQFEADYKNNFDLTCTVETSTCEISVKKELENSTLAKSGPLIITITATASQEKLTSQTVLVLDLPSNEDTDAQIEFKNIHYSAQYNIDSKTGKGSVDLNDGPIEFENSDNLSVDFQFEADYKNNFDLTCTVETSTCEISVKKELENSTLAKSGPLIITITATASQEKLTSQTVLVLDLPSNEDTDAQIEFKNIHYSAQYNIDSKTGKGSVDLNDGPIEFENSDNLSVDFQFEADYKNNFDLTCTVETSTCEISVKKELENSTLAKSGPLIITITATASQEKLTSQMVLVLDLPSNEDTDAQIEFKNVHYSAQYNVDSKTGKDSVDLNDGPIEFDNSDNLSVDFEFEADFKNNFNLSCNAKTSKCAISVINNLESSILAKKRQLAITIKAAASAGKLTSQTVLILDLPTTDDPNAELTFEYLHYAAQYILDPKTGKAWVNLTENPIKLNVVGDLDVDYEFEGFKDNFNLSCIESICNVVITKELENATLASFSQLVLTVTAAASAGQITSRTVLILELPVSEVDDAQIEFEKTHYAAQYVLESGKYVVNLTEGDIKLNNKDNLIVDVDFEDYDNNFKLKFNEDSSSYYIEVITELSDINSTQLILTATATAKNGELTAHTVIILDLPITENILSFKKSYYSAFYISNSLKLIDTIIVQSEDFSNLQFSFEDYDDNFKVEPLSKQGQYNVTMKDQLNQSLLEQAAEIYVVLVVTDSKSKLEASTVLTIKLPLYWNHVFEDDHYDAEYLKDESSDSDKVNVNRKIKIVDPEFSQLSVLGYEENFVISCNSTTLECSLSLVKNLNSSSLSSEELFLTLVASTMDQFSTGRSILLLKLPLRNSTFEFEKQLYQANYNIQSSEDELATISLVDVISLKGAYVTDVSIVCDDEYSHYFKFELTATGWELQLQKNIEAEVLSGQSQLITSLTASNSELTSFAKAAFIVNFPNETSVAFDKLQYFGDYIGGDSPSVTMEDEIVVSNSENCQIVLESFSEIFEVIQKKTNWLIKPKSKLNSTILSQYSEIYTEMRITKIGVPYGKAVLTIRLPEFNFSKKKYSGSYIVDDENVPKIEVEKIQVTDIDEDYIEVSLSDYSDYFKITSKSGVCTVSVIKLLPSKITNKYGTLVSTLTVSRKLDSRTLATSTLIITLPDTESTESPRFSDFSYYGDYKNSDTPTVELQQFIELAYDNEVVIESVKIDDSSSHYASNFEVKKKDYNTYIVDVVKPLTQEIFDELSTVVLTLVANSTQNEKDYAALVIALPKTVRNASVQVENQEILFNGTYDDGKFSSPQINLEFANNTKDSDVRVIISNDLGIDNKHFHYSYSSSKKLLTIQIDPFSDDLVSDISVIPLKLAITDINTQDTIFAVLNVKIADTNSAMPSNVGLIVAVSILAGLLLLLVVAAFVYWFYKIRKVKYSEMINQEAEAPNKTSLFTKNETKKLHGSASLRRPTGLGIGMVDAIPEDTSTDGVDGTPESSPEVERKVAFDDNVKKIEVDKESSGFKSVANRRPTEFVFGYPLESGVLDNTTYDRRESSDYNVDIAQERRTSLDLPEKKSVAFDENIERMHIDSVEADDSNHEDEEEEDQGPKQHKTEAELYTADEEQLPSQIFKEIF